MEEINNKEFREKMDYKEEIETPDIWDYDKRGNKKVNCDRASNYLTKKYIFKTINGIKDSLTYVFQDGIYSEVGIGFIKSEIETLIGESCNNYLVSEILGKIQRKTSFDKKEFEKTPINIIPFSNGGFNIETEEIEEYKPEWNFRHKLNVCYIKGMDCQQFKIFLEKTLYPEDLNLIQELFGFCLYRTYFLKKAFIFVGETNTGKTTLINVLVALLGINNCSGLSLQKIGVGKSFDLTFLYLKYLNFFDDLSSKDLIDNSGFKIATGGGYITAEKKFGDLFQFMSFAKLLFATNKIPPVKDLDDEAHFFRNIPVQFDNEVLENEIDPDLTNKLTTPEELSGVLNWALEGLFRLFENKKFSFDKSAEEIKAIMCRSGDPLYSFANDCLFKKEKERITKEEMFEVYRFYCQEKKITPLSKEQLGRKLQKIVPYIQDKREKERYWENVSLYDTYDTFLFNYREKIKDNSISLYMFSKEASKVSNKPKEDNILDKFTPEQIKEVGWTEKELQDALEDDDSQPIKSNGGSNGKT